MLVSLSAGLFPEGVVAVDGDSVVPFSPLAVDSVGGVPDIHPANPMSVRELAFSMHRRGYSLEGIRTVLLCRG